MLAYAHIPKAGGSTLIGLLRTQFGWKHLDLIHRLSEDATDRSYRPRDLRVDLRVSPNAKSIAGHWIKPWVSFEEFESVLRWYTFVREPCSRSFSQYVQDLELKRMPVGTSFDEWAKVDRLGGRNRNAQVRMIAGKEDADTAIEIVESKDIFVGLLEQYDLSLLAWRTFFALNNFSINYERPRNVRSDSPLVQTIRQKQTNLKKQLTEHNSEDRKFYNYIREVRFPAQLKRLGGEEKLRSIPKGLLIRGNNPGRTWENRIFRNTVYKPWVCVDRTLFAKRDVTTD